MKTNNLKPIEYDVHFKYLCPNSSCCYPHWLSIKEASINGFKVVCDCGTVFSVKQVEKIKIKYFEETSKKRDVFAEREQEKLEPIELDVVDHDDILEEKLEPSQSTFAKAKNLLIHYGFTANEAEEMIEKSILDNPGVDDYVFLVKQSLFCMKND